ncbi:nucleoside triphosphate hydrolase [Marinobacterium zhoushanense]|uniref:Nucleoside triphosphate hydrolase n=1 Tax=Marinobacterium zhoushanense TaxID=1679163 RepID=A0ABQ1K848_9GAMM|nr:nucleoside/nucleotide kinase family protein [Marinobacterium zhoushanense]GGB86657.1 nucleoside triphosphate hydrolase [Marinobacterium zhoushanense]
MQSRFSLTTGYSDALEQLCSHLLSQRSGNRRYILAVAGPPASGKSTLAEQLVAKLNATRTDCAALLPMDGFHLDNRILAARGLLSRKGAPETFDAVGFGVTVQRLHDRSSEIIHPVFDRTRDLAVAGAGVITPEVDVIVVEGNYLLLKQEPWVSMRTHYDLTVFLSPPMEVLEQRLIERWLIHGLEEAAAQARAQGNDIPNARLVLEHSDAGDIRLSDR